MHFECSLLRGNPSFLLGKKNYSVLVCKNQKCAFAASSHENRGCVTCALHVLEVNTVFSVLSPAFDETRSMQVAA